MLSLMWRGRLILLLLILLMSRAFRRWEPIGGHRRARPRMGSREPVRRNGRSRPSGDIRRRATTPEPPFHNASGSTGIPHSHSLRFTLLIQLPRDALQRRHDVIRITEIARSETLVVSTRVLAPSLQQCPYSLYMPPGRCVM